MDDELDPEQSESSRYNKYLQHKYGDFVRNSDVHAKLSKVDNVNSKLLLSTALDAFDAQEVNMDILKNLEELLEEAQKKYFALIKEPEDSEVVSSEDEEQPAPSNIHNNRDIYGAVQWKMPREIPTVSNNHYERPSRFNSLPTTAMPHPLNHQNQQNQQNIHNSQHIQNQQYAQNNMLSNQNNQMHSAQKYGGHHSRFSPPNTSTFMDRRSSFDNRLDVNAQNPYNQNSNYRQNGEQNYGSSNYRANSPQRFRRNSPQHFRRNSPQRFRPNSPQHYRSNSPQRYRSNSPQRYRPNSPQRFHNLPQRFHNSRNGFQQNFYSSPLHQSNQNVFQAPRPIFPSFKESLEQNPPLNQARTYIEHRAMKEKEKQEERALKEREEAMRQRQIELKRLEQIRQRKEQVLNYNKRIENESPIKNRSADSGTKKKRVTWDKALDEMEKAKHNESNHSEIESSGSSSKSDSSSKSNEKDKNSKKISARKSTAVKGNRKSSNSKQAASVAKKGDSNNSAKNKNKNNNNNRNKNMIRNKENNNDNINNTNDKFVLKPFQLKVPFLKRKSTSLDSKPKRHKGDDKKESDVKNDKEQYNVGASTSKSSPQNDINEPELVIKEEPQTDEESESGTVVSMDINGTKKLYNRDCELTNESDINNADESTSTIALEEVTVKQEIADDQTDSIDGSNKTDEPSENELNIRDEFLAACEDDELDNVLEAADINYNSKLSEEFFANNNQLDPQKECESWLERSASYINTEPMKEEEEDIIPYYPSSQVPSPTKHE